MKWILRARTWMLRQSLLLMLLAVLYPTLWIVAFTVYSPGGQPAEPFVVCMWAALFLVSFIASFPFGKGAVLFVAFLELGCLVVYHLGRTGPGLLHVLGLITMSVSLLLLGIVSVIFSFTKYEPPWDPFQPTSDQV